MKNPISSLNRMPRVGLACAALLVLASRGANAQTNITLPDTNQTTTLTATVSDQARVTVPAGVTFTVNDVSSATASGPASVTISNIVLASATKQVRVSLQADTPTFTPPVGGAATWSAGAVSWNAASWTNATGVTGTLSNSSYNVVATCAADAQTCSTTALTFTLAVDAGVKRSGSHTLTVRWKFESI